MINEILKMDIQNILSKKVLPIANFTINQH